MIISAKWKKFSRERDMRYWDRGVKILDWVARAGLPGKVT